MPITHKNVSKICFVPLLFYIFILIQFLSIFIKKIKDLGINKARCKIYFPERDKQNRYF